MIMHKELQFTNPKYFNDPFDSHSCLFDYEVKDGNPMGWVPKSFIQDKAVCDSKNIRRRAWICSLSKKNKSILMWSYYTNHKGVCIGLNQNALTNCLSNKLLGQYWFLNKDVQYRNIFERPNRISDRMDHVVYQLCTKGKEWEHEQEVRHIIIDPSPRIPYRMIRETSKREVIEWAEVRFYPTITSECFECIYLGINISDSDKLKIIKASKESLPGIAVIQLVPDTENFSFIEKPIDVDEYLSQHI